MAAFRITPAASAAESDAERFTAAAAAATARHVTSRHV